MTRLELTLNAAVRTNVPDQIDVNTGRAKLYESVSIARSEINKTTYIYSMVARGVQIGSMLLEIPEEKDGKSVVITELYASEKKKYKYIGSLFTQIAFEESILRGFGGRLSTSAVFNSHAFFYKMGMRSTRDTEILHELNAAKEGNRNPNTFDLPKTEMSLSEESIQNGKKIIAQTPMMKSILEHIQVVARKA